MRLDLSELNGKLERIGVKAWWLNRRKIVKARKKMSPWLLFLDNAERWFNYNVKQIHLLYRIKTNYWGPMTKYNPRNTYAYRKVAPDDFEPKQ